MAQSGEEPGRARFTRPHQRGHVLSSVGGAFMVAQLVLLFFLGHPWVPALRWVGYGLWALGCVLAWYPIFYFRRAGRVARGKSYVHTSQLVTSGLYSVVRHPQYASLFVFAFAFTLIGQHWVIVLLGVLSCFWFGLSLRGVDKGNIEKFGEAYERYREQVPGYNVVAGVFRLIGRRMKSRPGG